MMNLISCLDILITLSKSHYKDYFNCYLHSINIPLALSIIYNDI